MGLSCENGCRDLFIKIWTIKQLAQGEMYYIKLTYRKKTSYQGELDILRGLWRLKCICTEVEQNNWCFQDTFHFYYFKWILSAKHKNANGDLFQIRLLLTLTSLLYGTTHTSSIWALNHQQHHIEWQQAHFDAAVFIW